MQSGGFREVLPLQDATGDTPDISEYLGFVFYDHVSYKDNAGIGMTAIRMWLGVSNRICGIMLYWILPHKVTVISIITVQHLTIIEE